MRKMIFPNSLEEVQLAAAFIRAGRLVAFPTETVYGLGANALDAAAVEKIFRAKRRPTSSPLIVHVESRERATDIVAEWPDTAEKLAREFWPGPLTLVLPKRECIPGIVTAGLPTVGVRVPANSLALALLAHAGVPIGAPSANRFTELSPTTVEHVRKSLGNEVDFILDGGPTTVGIESTVLSLAGPMPVLLRPGMISREQMEGLIGPIEPAGTAAESAHPSPGMHPKHYSPRTRLVLNEPPAGCGIYLWLTQQRGAERSIHMPTNPAHYAAALYETLHRLDDEHLDWIALELPPDRPEWAGIRDRLQRAAAI